MGAILLGSPVSTFRFPLAFAAALLLCARAFAGPLDDAHVADTGFSGPTTGDLTAIYWNPAGLGLLQGPQVMLGGTLQMTSVEVARTSIDPTTGMNPGSTSFPTVNGSATTHPFRWAPGPNGFFAIGAGIGRRFGIAAALYSPFSSSLTMHSTATGDDPTRYHLLSMSMNHIAIATGLALHASDSIQVGVVPVALFPSVHLAFDEDTGLAQGSAENPALAVGYDFSTRGMQAPAWLLSLGAHYRHGPFSVGLAYTSAPLGTGGTVTIAMDDTQINLGSGLASTQGLCSGGATSGCLTAQMLYRLPSQYIGGATWQAGKHWSVTGIARFIRYSAHDKINIVISGPTSTAGLGGTVPDHIVLYRGFQDSWDVRGRVAYEDKQFRVGGTLRLETSAVPAANVNAAAIDGLKLEPSIAAEMRVWRQIHLSAGYAFLYMLPVSTGASVFNPSAVSTCAAAGGDLSTSACQARMNGQARPSAAGDYHLWRQTVLVMTTIGF